MARSRGSAVGWAAALLILAAAAPAGAETWIKAVPGGTLGDMMVDADSVMTTADGAIVYRTYNSAYPGYVDEHRVHCGQKAKHGAITVESREIRERGEEHPTLLFGSEQVFVDSLLGASAKYVCRKHY